MKNKILLPDRMSGLITTAMVDLEYILGQPTRYILDAYEWHKPRMGSNPTHVCLAGCVMAGTLRAPRHENLTPYDFPANTRDKLFAINLLRQGRILDASRLVPRIHGVREWDVLQNVSRQIAKIKFTGEAEFSMQAAVFLDDLRNIGE